ncbi:hypothetical protein DL96DRAFT_201073 [Flagelloscypha sp. PMI_526]|nr:hypothetical protein DL96DRAFT_201073 [Flagelloscypha sp. PMI_526]
MAIEVLSAATDEFRSAFSPFSQTSTKERTVGCDLGNIPIAPRNSKPNRRRSNALCLTIEINPLIPSLPVHRRPVPSARLLRRRSENNIWSTDLAPFMPEAGPPQNTLLPSISPHPLPSSTQRDLRGVTMSTRTRGIPLDPLFVPPAPFCVGSGRNSSARLLATTLLKRAERSRSRSCFPWMIKRCYEPSRLSEVFTAEVVEA